MFHLSCDQVGGIFRTVRRHSVSMHYAMPDDPYVLNSDGLFAPSWPVSHRGDEFNERQLEVYAEIERYHFWYAGRRRFILYSVRRNLTRLYRPLSGLRAIDLGAGCGGWVAHLAAKFPRPFTELAIGDSSPRALELAKGIVGPSVGLYQTDLRRLEWSDRWDVVFLLDVLEHISDHETVLKEVSRALRPGGLAFITVPALEILRTYNDELERHAHRYSRRDFQNLANLCGLELVESRYFMFFLSPLLIASRFFGPDVAKLCDDERIRLYRHTHRTPWAPVNALLRWIFNLETPLGYWFPFIWGTSLLGVFRKPG